MKRCQFCAEEIQDAAIVCKHCGRDLLPPSAKKPKAKAGFGPFWVGGAVVVLSVIIGVVSQFRSGSAAHPLTNDQIERVYQELDRRGLDRPKQLGVASTGFVTADFEIDDRQFPRLRIPVREYGQQRLLAIRDVLLRDGLTDYRVNINGTPPGVGLVKRYGSARFMDVGELEWLTPD